jgi:Uma2 family endonuclease
MLPEDPRDPGNGAPTVSSSPAPFITPEQYLDAERHSETKSEYLDGQVFAMTGASVSHNLIVANIVGLLHGQLRGGECRVYASGMRLLVSTSGLHTYPDVTVVCGEPRLADQHRDTLLNPTVLIEVLSDTTERYDRGRKAEHYRRLESLREYLLVAQHEPRVEHYRRAGERDWMLSEAIGPAEAVELASVGCTLALSEVYDGVL